MNAIYMTGKYKDKYKDIYLHGNSDFSLGFDQEEITLFPRLPRTTLGI